MLEDMDNIEASCDMYVKVTTYSHLEQSKTTLLIVNHLGMVRLTVHHDLIVSVSFMCYPRNYLRKHQQRFFALNNFLFIGNNHAMVAAVQHNISLLTNNQPRTNILHISGQWVTPATSHNM